MKWMGVIGAGQMGAGIAQVAAQSGLHVCVVDAHAPALERGKAGVMKSLSRLKEKGKLNDEEVQQTIERMRWSPQLNDAKEAGLVVEAVPENEALKKGLLSELDKLLAPESIIASNTSSISITRLASATKRPDRVIGMHFMNPVPIMKLVEVIRGMATSDETYAKTVALAESMGKTTTVSRDFPGFIANRVLMPMINEAFFALMEGLASAEDIDTTLRLGANQPMGPLTLADFIGLDTCLAIIEVLHHEMGDGKYRPCPLLRQYVDAGYLGKKSGRGVFAYDV